MKTKQPELNKITALYERLSRDDEQSGDSNRPYTWTASTISDLVRKPEQQIDIYLKYVGKLDVPMPELTPDKRTFSYFIP